MELNRKHIKIFIWIYLGTYVLNFLWNLAHGVSFTGIDPIIITNTLDATLHLILATPLLSSLMRSGTFRIVFDSFALLLPVILCISYLKNKRFTGIIAVLTAFYCLVYYLLLCAVSYYSSEVFICWTLIPLIFITTKPVGFYYRMQVTRLVFALMFFSSALWKLSSVAIFQSGQMAAVLLHQHISILQYQGTDSFSRMAFYLIEHPLAAQLLYIGGFLLEFSFVVAFFTKRFDKFLILLLILFLISDFVLMGINYFPWVSFIGCFYLSALREPNPELYPER